MEVRMNSQWMLARAQDGPQPNPESRDRVEIVLERLDTPGVWQVQRPEIARESDLTKLRAWREGRLKAWCVVA
jgi:hypothetical protein